MRRVIMMNRYSTAQRLSLALDAAIKAYKYPTDADHVSHLGELTSYYCLQNIHQRMLNDSTGRRILMEKPRITTETFNSEELIKLDVKSFGHQYAKFMLDRGFSSDERPKVKYIDDPELAYVYQRYKEIHDFIHVLLQYDVTVHDEIIVKWYEMAQLGLPSATLASTVGLFKLSCDELKGLYSKLDMILKTAQRSFIMNVYFEEEKETDITALRERLGIYL